MKFATGWGEVFIRGFTPPRLASSLRSIRADPPPPVEGKKTCDYRGAYGFGYVAINNNQTLREKTTT
jgi:hypothetical protein